MRTLASGLIVPDDLQLIRVGVKGIILAESFKPDGTLRCPRSLSRNGVTNAGFNLMLDSTFASDIMSSPSAPITAWYIGLIGNASFTGLSASDTMSSHAGWTEDTTHYTPTVSAQRPLWGRGTASSKSTTNATSVNYAINTDSTVIKGIFVVSNITIGGTTGTLWSSGLFTADQTLFNGDTLKITYTVSLS